MNNFDRLRSCIHKYHLQALFITPTYLFMNMIYEGNYKYY